MGQRRCPFLVGREISYCHSCGNRLVETESAVLHDNRRFCRSCCPSPTVEVVPAAQRRQSSTRLRMQGGAAAPKVRETTRIRKRRPVGWIIAASVLVAAGVGLAIAAGGSPAREAPSPVAAPLLPVSSGPKPAAEPPLDELLSRIREIRGSDLMFERRPEVLGLLKDAAGRSGPRLEEVDQLALEYDRKFEQAAARLADFARSEAMRMAAKQKYAEAIERLDGFPAAFKTSKSAEPLRVLRQDFERRRAESSLPPPAQPQRQFVGARAWRT